MSGMKNSCTYDYQYSKGFDSCLFLHGEPLQLTLLICTISIFILLVFLSVMLIIAKKLLPKLIKEKDEVIHSFVSQSVAVLNHEIQESTKLDGYSNEQSQHSFNVDESQERLDELATN